MESPDEFTGSVNLGNPVESTMADLARRILELTGSKSMLEFKPLLEDDPRKRLPNISLARERLSWEPVVSLEGG